jgi:hypothetical protein
MFQDVSPENVILKEISDTLKKSFGYNLLISKSMVKYNSANDDESLYFFPGGNTRGREDEVLRSLLEKIEETTDDPEKSPWVKEERPIDWFKVMDKLDALKGSHMTLTMAETMQIAEECSIVDKVEFKELLSFLNEMGAILWINEEGLRDVIILYPIKFFIKPASMLIVLNYDVKKKKKLFDEIQLPRDIKELTKKGKKFDSDWWELMTEKGILEHGLLEHILEKIIVGVETEDMISSVIKLMTTFGILVPLSLRSEYSQQYVLRAANNAAKI